MRRTKMTDEALLLVQDAIMIARKNPDNPMSPQLLDKSNVLAANLADPFLAIELSVMIETFKKRFPA